MNHRFVVVWNVCASELPHWDTVVAVTKSTLSCSAFVRSSLLQCDCSSITGYICCEDVCHRIITPQPFKNIADTTFASQGDAQKLLLAELVNNTQGDTVVIIASPLATDFSAPICARLVVNTSNSLWPEQLSRFFSMFDVLGV